MHPGNIESHDQQANAPNEGAEGEDQTTHLQQHPCKIRPKRVISNPKVPPLSIGETGRMKKKEKKKTTPKKKNSRLLGQGVICIRCIFDDNFNTL